MISYTHSKKYIYTVENKVLSIIESLTTIKQCEPASKIIDLFEIRFGCTEFVKDMRKLLRDTTFRLCKKEGTTNDENTN